MLGSSIHLGFLVSSDLFSLYINLETTSQIRTFEGLERVW